MTHEEFDIAFKIFTRFLKDNGYYKLIMKYLFPPGRTKEDLYNKGFSEEQTFKISFINILNYIHVIGPMYNKLGQEYWDKHIEKVNRAWKKKCIEEFPQYDEIR